MKTKIMNEFLKLKQAKEDAITVILRARKVNEDFTPEMENDMRTINNHYIRVLRDADMLDCLILSELRDFGSFYAGDFEEVKEYLSPLGITSDEVEAVYKKYYQTEGRDF